MTGHYYDDYAYGDGYYEDDFYNSSYEVKESLKETDYRVFKDDQDRNRYELMLAGYWKPEKKTDEKDRYNEMLAKQR
jgi:hypothetical protein